MFVHLHGLRTVKPRDIITLRVLRKAGLKYKRRVLRVGLGAYLYAPVLA